MKKYISKIFIMIAVALSFSTVAHAQFVVKVRPLAPVLKVRPACPSPRHVWVTGEYAWRGNQYIYTDGYWAEPPVRGHRWVEGHWKGTRIGWIWVPGHWRR